MVPTKAFETLYRCFKYEASMHDLRQYNNTQRFAKGSLSKVFGHDLLLRVLAVS